MKVIDQELIDEFLAISDKKEIAKILGVEYKILAYNLYKISPEEKYKTFEIKKRNGKSRKIIAPNSGIKFIQTNLSKILLEIYKAKSSTHGFLKERSIKTNALPHVKKRIVINLDLENFFPAINFGRVRGIFLTWPFNFPETIATILAQICCFEGCLPQGAPSSPIISNYICRKLDNCLLKFAKKNRLTYTRYADDITFSTNLREIPKGIGVIKENKLIISEELNNIITSNGFSINIEKIRYAFSENRQEVTGLIVNSFPNINRKYIRHVRAMLHAWEEFGIEAAAKEHFSKYNYKNKTPKLIELSFQNELVGKIGFIGHIRGKDDDIYHKLYKRIKKINPDVKLSFVKKMRRDSNVPIIYGEGKTDWKHLEAALKFFNTKGEYIDLNITFMNYQEHLEMNNKELMKICEGNAKTGFYDQKLICLFDRDDQKINKKAVENNFEFKHWGNNVYSALLPIPSHRDFNEICIEHYYSDEDIKTMNDKGRRLYLSNEFNKSTRMHLIDCELMYINKNFLQATYPRIIEYGVLNESGKNIALSKNAFADNCLSREGNFSKISFENFSEIFDLIRKIINHNPLEN
jgi:RNA-directed DNA polymerase